MNIIRKAVVAFLSVVLILSGCISGSHYQTIDDNTIINNYVAMYASSTNSQNDDIAAILREFSTYVVLEKASSWADLQKKEDLFMMNISTNFISYYYTIIPSDEEIRISDGFLDMIIMYDTYYNPSWIYSINQRIPSISSRFITKMNDYEYNTRTNR